jgi:predicted dehydrogenase
MPDEGPEATRSGATEWSRHAGAAGDRAGCRRRAACRRDTATESVDRSDPLANQVTRFAAVIRGEAQPVCSGRDGLNTLKVVDAVVEAARTGGPVDVAV